MNTLQNIVFPNPYETDVQELYFRCSDLGSYDAPSLAVRLEPGAELNLNTYFNQFSVQKWRRFTHIETFSLELDLLGSGEAYIELCSGDGQNSVISKHQFDCNVRSLIHLPSHDFQNIPNGLISCRIVASGKCSVFAGRFVSATTPTRDIQLGIVITAFRRDENVIASAERLSVQVIDKFPGKIALTIIDNGQTLSEELLPHNCKLISNNNYGGAGGFSRGLLHFHRQQEGFTHCLFMDDDASCESEAILRSVSFLEYARDSKTAIAGAMLFENEPWLQHENGAHFDMSCRPLKTKLDLRKSLSLLDNDVIEPIGYGAWWYFMFPLEGLKHYPFPFFVRGDDILFSMVNCFQIVSINGVASWQDSFATKKSPMTLYLDTRSHVMHYFLASKLKYSTTKVLLMYWKFLLKNLCSYQYATADAISIGFADAMNGREFWSENLDMSRIRENLAPLIDEERLLPLAEYQAFTENQIPSDSLLKKTLRWVTLSGHLIPKALLIPSVSVSKSNSESLHKTFGGRELTIIDSQSQTGRTLQHSKRRFFSGAAKGIYLSLKFLISTPKLHEQARLSKGMMTEDFWRSTLGTDET